MTAIHWFRRDLRLKDNTALFNALKDNKNVVCVFIFDTAILDKLPNKDDARVTFIHQQLERIKKTLNKLNSDLLVYYGDPIKLWPRIIKDQNAQKLYFNRDYEPYATKRDIEITLIANQNKVETFSFKDHVIFEKDEVLKDNGDPYVVYTPYSKKWKNKLAENVIETLSIEPFIQNFKEVRSSTSLSLKDIGFTESNIEIDTFKLKANVLLNYYQNRNFPSKNGTTKLSVHLRFGTISIREVVKLGLAYSEKWLNELIWRDFYIQILSHFPSVAKGEFKPKYANLKHINNEDDFESWCNGKTGYPLVDAGMRELNATGFMHNRVRMVVASFLTKHLLIDYKWGEAYFANKLSDYDLASNNGGWQWAAGCGVDAAPYFRIFNPHTQLKRFDNNLEYVKKWIPEYGTDKYPNEVVNHKLARERCLQAYKTALA